MKPKTWVGTLVLRRKFDMKDRSSREYLLSFAFTVEFGRSLASRLSER